MSPLQSKNAKRFAGELSARQFFFIVGVFWLYVTVSNVLYAYGMRLGVAQMTKESLFAPWDARVIQHLLLLPMLVVSYWASLRIDWRPPLIAIPLQAILAAFFAALAYPALAIGEKCTENPAMHEHMSHAPLDLLMDQSMRSLWLASFVNFLPAYGFGLALVTGFGLYAQFRNSELKRAALEREWSAARLAALRMQLSPHTLFNLLHTIRGYIEWDPKGAQAMVVQLADLLRRLLNAGEQELSRLTDELQFVRLYLALQQCRFADRLSVILPSAEGLADVWVPSLILQPLVENAVVHGLADHQGSVVVRVSVQRVPDALVLRVANTVAADRAALEGAAAGRSAADGPAPTDGIGLKNVRERLAVQFEGRASLSAGMRGAEWVSEITLPEVRDSPRSEGEAPAGRPVHA